MSKDLDTSSATAWVAQDLLKALTVLSYTTVRKSAADQEDLKPYWKLEKRQHLSTWSIVLLFEDFTTLGFSKTLLTTKRRPTGR